HCEKGFHRPPPPICAKPLLEASLLLLFAFHLLTASTEAQQKGEKPQSLKRLRQSPLRTEQSGPSYVRTSAPPPRDQSPSGAPQGQPDSSPGQRSTATAALRKPPRCVDLLAAYRSIYSNMHRVIATPPDVLKHRSCV